MARERFGTEEKRSYTGARAKHPNRREREIAQLRKEIKALNKQYKQASLEEQQGIKELTTELRGQLRRLRRAERSLRRRKKKEAKQARFIKDPYRFAKTLLGETRSGRLTSSKEVVEEFLRDSHNDALGNQALGVHPRVGRSELPEEELNTREPTWREVQDIVQKARSASAPGPSTIPYKVYKKCPMLLRRLWRLLRRIWVKGVIPPSWKRAEGCFVPKEKDSSEISQFRTISLLSVEGKIFFSVLARRITTFMVKNKYIDTSIQKGGIPGFSGCLEHTGILSQLIREAKESKGNRTVIWLDLANAYGSIPPCLINAAMEHYHIPQMIRGMITSYFGGFKLRFQTDQFTTQWQDLEKGIVTGCTISPILFVMGMNLLITAAGKESRGPTMMSGIRQPSMRGFMDDLTITTAATHVEARWILNALDDVATWARMKFKPKKSRSMVIRNGKVAIKYRLEVQGEVIPSIKDNPIKCLGKWYDSSLNDRSSVSMSEKQAADWLERIDRSGLPGKFKAWLFQHGLLPRLLWLLTIYEVAMTTVEGIERRANKHLRKWLGIPPSFTSVGLYNRSGQLQLPLSSVVEEFKVAKCRVAMMYRDSTDDKVRGAGVTTRSGRKWAADASVARAEHLLKLRDIIGNQCIGRQGLGSTHFQQWGKADPRQKRDMIQAEVRQLEEEGRRSRAVELGAQCAWTKWDLPKRKITWSEIWRLEPFRISFLLRSVYDTLPSPTNLHRWGLREDPQCRLCGERGTMAHILAGCKTALSQGRYRWRHDKVLMALADVLERERRKKHQVHTQPLPPMQFIKEGEKPPPPKKIKRCLLQTAPSWEMRVDLGRKLQFPQVVQTPLRPDVVIWSDEAKKIILIELTVPWEDGCSEASERKASKYQDLVQQCRDKGWQAWLFPVEVGCRGFPAQSVWKMLTALGIIGRERRKAIRRLEEAAERTSCWLWSRREEFSWGPGEDG
ncbi:retrovirus-related Pol polyprotein from type-1 retrotransposable element R2 [Brachionichthys hirsutus]|uniref:retrovirus-related Pol polyprotein from type-1 retrotransposable element R2 n=1 Tax=Brachionichthys hirsutus TaxID=412623 RepID=UPI0036043A70